MSGGQQQRVGIARALVVNPEIIFADEPTGNLDSNTSLEVMHLMQNISRKKNQTIVMVTHDDYLAGCADKIIRILDGKVIDIKINERKDPVETPKEETPKEEPKEETEEETEEITAEKTDNQETAEQENTQA